MFASHCLAILTRQGHKITANRRQIISFLAEQKTPLSPYDIVKQSPTKLDSVSVYRFLDLLVSLHCAHKIHSLNAYLPLLCTNKTTDHYHVFAVCDLCKVCIIHSQNTMSILEGLSLYPHNHAVEVVGRCNNCHNSQ